MRDKILVISLAIVGVLLVTWLILEFACTRTFVGTLVARDNPIHISFNHSHRVYDDEDKRWETRGEDATTGTQTFYLTFYSEGKMRNIKVGSNYTKIRQADVELAVRQALAAKDVPAEYHSPMKIEYLVKVRGWLLDGSLDDLTPMAAIKAE
jgi:hypothetical protein